MTKTFDIVVAGGGHNSLVSAAYLAKAGLRVLVLDAQPHIGGSTQTEELTLPGFHHDSCSSAHVLIQSSPTIRNNELGLDRFGLEYLFPDPAVTMPFEDGQNITMWRDQNRTEQEFARYSMRDAQAYRRLIEEYEAVKSVFGAYRYTPIGYGPTLDEALAARPDGAYWMRRYRQSALEIIEEYFEHPNVRAFMLWLALLTNQRVDQPMTGRLAYALAYGRQRHSWTTPRRGSGALPEALVKLIQAHGGEINTNKRIAALDIENGRCVGVTTADGETYRASQAVLSTIHIRHLVDMAPPDAWGDQFVESVSQWRAGLTFFVAHYALSEPPLYPVDGERLPAVAAGFAGSVDNMLDMLNNIQRGRLHNGEPVFLAVCSSVTDPSRAPTGNHTLKTLSIAPYDLAESVNGDWEAIKQDVAARDLDRLRAAAPNITQETILGAFIETPRDLESRNLHNWRGTCHGGEMAPAQSGPMRPVSGWASHRMPIDGLYQTGATTHPGGSVSGGPGRNAAWVMLDDLGLALDDVIGAPHPDV